MSDKESIVHVYNTVLRTYRQSEHTFKLLFWTYLALLCVSAIICDIVYVAFAVILLNLVYFAEYKKQQCDYLKQKLRDAQQQAVDLFSTPQNKKQ